MSHDDSVRRIAEQLRHRESGRPVALRKKAVSHQVPMASRTTDADDRIDVSDLCRILRLDPEKRICVAESGVTFVDLVGATMKHGLVPVVVPELKTITVGGAVSGCSIESTSFRYGGFHDSCLEYEVITGTGEVLICTPDNENRLLFQMMHGTFGTLGIVSKLTFRLIPAKSFVHVTYETHRSLADFKAAIWRHFRAQDVDFMDGMIHAPDLLILCVGRFVDKAPFTSRYDWLKVYYLSTRRRDEDYLRTEDYFFRYDRGVTNVHPKTFLGRLLLGKFLGSTQLLRLANLMRPLWRKQKPTVTLDVFLPFSRADEFLCWYRERLGHFPLWCVPYRRVRDYEWLSDAFFKRTADPLFLDLAIYGMKQPPGPINYYKLIEDKLLEIGGMKTLISHNYYSESAFWRIWNRDTYRKAKAMADPANVFRDLYSKTTSLPEPIVEAPR
jgi:hypothetical protein